jgi:pyruvate dehydrogenase E2 component (dihydrolipoamide acetyltransferase)
VDRSPRASARPPSRPSSNAREVAILGLAPRLVLPLSLSYDHRVIDGAGAARFTAYLAELLADMRRMVL